MVILGQGLTLRASNPRGTVSTPGWGNFACHVVWPIKKMMVTSFGRKILITLREGKKEQVIAYEVKKDEFLIKKMN